MWTSAEGDGEGKPNADKGRDGSKVAHFLWMSFMDDTLTHPIAGYLRLAILASATAS